MLVDHADAERRRRLRVGDPPHLAVDLDLAAVGRDEPDQDLHQRRLAGAVLAEDAVDLAAVEVEVDAVAGDDVAVALGDPCGWRRRDAADRSRSQVGHSSDRHPVVTGAPPPP